MDAYGHKLYSIGSLSIKSCNYAACIGRFVHSVFNDLAPLLELIPEDSRQRAIRLCNESFGCETEHRHCEAYTRDICKNPHHCDCYTQTLLAPLYFAYTRC